MNGRKIAVAGGAALLSISGALQAEISANIGVTSNYVWRGITQTDDEAAVQGGLDFAHDSGFYVGTWASNVDFGDGDRGSEFGTGQTEWDVYAGFGGELNDFSYDIGYIHYFYPDTGNSDFGELGLKLGYGPFSAGIQYTVYSSIDKDQFWQAFVEDDIYVYANASIDLPLGFTGGITVGHYFWDEDGDPIQGSGESWDGDYTHVQLDLGKSAGDFGDFTFSLSWAEETDQDFTDDSIIPFVSWTKTFE
jgi:uncharacterized protein (TIGR02001 family)